MKLARKIVTGLAAIMLTASPLTVNFTHTEIVQAAKKAKGQITFIGPTHIYNKYGQKTRSKSSGDIQGYEVDVNGYRQIDFVELDTSGTLPYYGTRNIRGQKYYNLGRGDYVNAASVGTVNGKNSKKGKLVLNHNSLLYTKTGKSTGQSLAKNAIVRHQGKVQPVSSMPKFFAYKYQPNNHQEQILSLPTSKIKGKEYYSLGHNRYVKAMNVGSVDGLMARYNGVTTATVLKKTKTQTITNSLTKHTLKKGQKVKVDLSVEPYAEDYEGNVIRLHDYPDEYVDEMYLSLRIALPQTDYQNLVYSFVKPLKSTNVKLYDFNGQPTNLSVKGDLRNFVTVDGLFYIWLPSEKKAELVYHFANVDFTSPIVNSDGSPIQDQIDPKTGWKIENVNDQITRTNSFIKASDVNFASGIKLSALNTAEQAQADQKVASATDKKELQDLVTKGQAVATSNEYQHALGHLKNNYDKALVHATNLLRSNTATIAQVKEAAWLVKLTRTQMTTLDFVPSS